MDGACSMYGERRGAYRILVGKPEGKRPLGSPRLRWEVNIKMDGFDCGSGLSCVRLGLFSVRG